MIFLTTMLMLMLFVFAIDTIRKRHKFLEGGKWDVSSPVKDRSHPHKQD